MKVVNLAEMFSRFDRHRDPKGAASRRGTDDVFLVIEGEGMGDVGDKVHGLGPGEIFVVPAGVRHRFRAKRQAKVLLIEPRGTSNTGDPATAAKKEQI